MSVGGSAPHTEQFSDVERAEQDWIRERRIAAGGVAADAPIVGLALSGGGIRSDSSGDVIR